MGGPPPDNFTDFQRVVELVGTDMPSREAARARFRFYRERGFSPLTHDVEDRDGSR
ncbi:MAG: DNA polymerase III subunit chi [Lautropia sp.]|nr:DNA polymerase III subunit chi [Lautropia sp.]